MLSASAFVLRFFTPDHADDRVLIANLGCDLTRASFAEPLLAPPGGSDWTLRWSSEDAAYGGAGTGAINPHARWCIPGESAIVLAPGERTRPPFTPKVRRTA